MEEVWTLQRSTADGKLAGVCAALASRYGVDPLLVRIVVVLLALSAGFGIALYAAAWALLPSDKAPVPPMHRLLPGTSRFRRSTWTWLVGIWTVLVVIVLGQFLTIGLGPVLVVAALWWFGVIKPRSGSPTTRQRAALPATPSEQAFLAEAVAWRTRVEAQVRGVDWQVRAPETHGAVPFSPRQASPTTPTPTPAPPPAPVYEWQPAPWAAYHAPAEPVRYRPLEPYAVPAPGAVAPSQAVRRKRRRVLGLVTLAATVVTCTALAGVGAMDPAGIAATALLIVGLALVLAAWSGRPKGLLPAGIVLLLVVLGSLSPTQAVEMSSFHPQHPNELPQTISASVGDMVLDLSDLTVSENRTVDIRLAAGDVTVVCPEGINVIVEARMGAGMFTDPDGALHEGPGRFTFNQQHDPSAPTLVLSVDVALGELRVVRT